MNARVARNEHGILECWSCLTMSKTQVQKKVLLLQQAHAGKHTHTDLLSPLTCCVRGSEGNRQHVYCAVMCIFWHLSVKFHDFILRKKKSVNLCTLNDCL